MNISQGVAQAYDSSVFFSDGKRLCFVLRLEFDSLRIVGDCLLVSAQINENDVKVVICEW